MEIHKILASYIEKAGFQDLDVVKYNPGEAVERLRAVRWVALQVVYQLEADILRLH